LPFDDGSLAVNDALTVCDVALCFCVAFGPRTHGRVSIRANNSRNSLYARNDCWTLVRTAYPPQEPQVINPTHHHDVSRGELRLDLRTVIRVAGFHSKSRTMDTHKGIVFDFKADQSIRKCYIGAG